MMYHEIGDHIFNNNYEYNIKPNEDDYVLCYGSRNVLLIGDTIPTYKEAMLSDHNYIYAFSIDDKKYFLCLDSVITETPIQIFRTIKPLYLSLAIITGYHLFNWYNKNKYCGACGKKTFISTTVRALECECGNQIFPTIAPAVIVGLIHNDRILLTKYQTGYNNLALVAGYNEIGETLEQTVVREVLEEVGLHVNKVKYFKNQPWGLSGTNLVGFWATVSDSDDTPILQESELSFGKWFKKDEIDLETSNTSLTREMILYFKNNEVEI